MHNLIKKHNQLIWTIFVMALVILAYGLFRPTPPEEVFANSDKVGHFVAFFVVSITGRVALHTTPGWFYWGVWFVLAGLLEYLQGELRPQRIFSLEDAYANAVGVLIAIAAYWGSNKILSRNKSLQNEDAANTEQ